MWKSGNVDYFQDLEKKSYHLTIEKFLLGTSIVRPERQAASSSIPSAVEKYLGTHSQSNSRFFDYHQKLLVEDQSAPDNEDQVATEV